MEQQVYCAAMAMMDPMTDSQTRSAASSLLEQWTLTPEAWDVYQTWLHSCRQNLCSEGMQLLCLTLLHRKIQRELRLSSSPPNVTVLHGIRQVMLEWLISGSTATSTATTSKSIINQLCACLTAMIVRLGSMKELVDMCSTNNQHTNTTTTVTHFKLLGAIPPELEACSGDLSTSQVTTELWPYLEVVLDTIRRSIATTTTEPSIHIAALECLRNWALICHVTLSHLNSPTCGGNEPLLPCFISILSNTNSVSEVLLIASSQALTEAIVNPADTCTPTRVSACQLMLSSMETTTTSNTLGFIVAPFRTAVMNRWDDAAHALATLVCTLVTEEVDDIVTQPAEACLALLLQIQHHEHIPISLCVMDVWLTVQEVPTSCRHENWKQSLFINAVEGLVRRISYPKSFQSWEEEVELDPQEFSELRRVVADVVTSSYFLLRVKFVKLVISIMGVDTNNTHWTMVESGLYCLTCVAREVCARVKARGRATAPSPVTADRDETSHELLQLVERLCSQRQLHPLAIGAVASFVGGYAPAWNVHCSQEAILQLLRYLRATMSNHDNSSSCATRAIYVGCASKLLEGPEILEALRDGMAMVLTTDSEEGMSAVAEGSTRLAVQLKDPTMVQPALSTILIPLLQRADHAMNASVLQGDPLAAQALAKYLHILSIVIRCCDVVDGVYYEIWPFLEKVALHAAGKYESVLDKLLAIHSQLLFNAPDLVAPNFSETVKFVVDAYEKTKHPRTLATISCAVEAFSPMSGETEASFNQLLCHITGLTYTYITTEKHPDDCPLVIQAFFEMNQRYIMFCPLALVRCSQFAEIVSLGTTCLSACKGERESTRATLNFLAHLFGWRSLRLPHASTASLEDVSGPIDEELAKHGKVITQVCIGGLSGGSPQPLWPALSDCLFAIVSHVSKNAPEEHYTMAHEWVYNALMTVRTHSNGNSIPHDTIQQMMTILFDLARAGAKSKPKAKMLLTDFAKMAKGEMDTNSLLSYTLA